MNCAICGDHAPKSEPVPHSVEDYLHDRYNVPRPIHGYRIPLCSQHAMEYDQLRPTLGGGEASDSLKPMLKRIDHTKLTDESPFPDSE